MPFTLYVETDNDFSLMFEGKLYESHAFTIEMEDASELDNVKVLGPYGVSMHSDVKCHEYRESVKAIKENPTWGYDSTGGNRGVRWERIDRITYARHLKDASEYEAAGKYDLAFVLYNAAMDASRNVREWDHCMNKMRELRGNNLTTSQNGV